MRGAIRRNKLIAVAFLAYVTTLILDNGLFVTALQNTWMYIREMLQVFPAVIVLAALITVWVPPHVIMKNFGAASGLRGKLASVLVGSVSAGPIYAAFPMTQSLLRKGASLANVVVIISAWAVVKVPMLIVEVQFLGIEFAAARYLFTVPAIIGIGALVSTRLSRDDVIASIGVPSEENAVIEELLAALPGANCGGCGYGGCAAFAEHLLQGEVEPSKCAMADDAIEHELRSILARDAVSSR